NAITDSVRHTGSSPRIPPSTARIRSRLVPRHVATGYPKTGRRITAPRCCSPRGNGSLLWSTPLLGALANGSIASPSEYTARCGPETQVMAALPSTKTSTPQLSVSKPLVPRKGSQRSRTLRSEQNVPIGLLMPPGVHSISAGRPAALDIVLCPVHRGLLESVAGTAVGCPCLGDFFPHDTTRQRNTHIAETRIV